MKLNIGNMYLAPDMTKSHHTWNKLMPPVFPNPSAAEPGSAYSDTKTEMCARATLAEAISRADRPAHDGICVR
ncbi:hypothetical protein [Bradyrhizobium sp. LB11.1]|uniref:hypothetical protein n=1 Tax=Bradyrhizobium sp. LB11.1 TaxID=3156326 RepID=UPI0033978479